MQQFTMRQPLAAEFDITHPEHFVAESADEEERQRGN
jgi:hypothetical protein